MPAPQLVEGTVGFTINNDGTLVGYYIDGSNVSHGYVLRDGSGRPSTTPRE